MGRSEKELEKTVTIEFLNYDTGNAKKLANILKIRLRKKLKGVTVNIQPFKQKLKLETEQQYDISDGWIMQINDVLRYV